MKALSIRQPWAELILRGEKTLELRTWKVNHRGPMLIHAAALRRPERVRQFGLDPNTLPYGALVGMVELIEVFPLDEATYETLREDHRSDRPYPGSPLYGWRLTRPRPLSQPIPWPGRQGLFNVPEDALRQVGEAVSSAIPAPPPDPSRPFVLYTFPANGHGYRAVLYQWLGKTTREHAGPQWWQVDLNGTPMQVVSEAVVHAVRQAGYRPGDLVRRFGEPFYLPEPVGVRLALLFLAARPLSRVDRLDALMVGIARMSDEEAYYWFSKCSSGPEALRAQKALRVLLAKE